MSLFHRMSERFTELSLREKILIAGCGLAVIAFAGSSLGLKPMLTKYENQQAQISNFSDSNDTMTQNIQELRQRLKQDPNQDLDRQYADLSTFNLDLSKKLDGIVTNLVSADQMASLLEKVLRDAKGLKLVSLESQKAEPIVTNPNNPSDIGYYIHPVKIVVTGSYFDISNYLNQLESLPVSYFWRSFDYKVTKYPQAQVALEVYTLGTRQEFIGG